MWSGTCKAHVALQRSGSPRKCRIWCWVLKFLLYCANLGGKINPNSKPGLWATCYWFGSNCINCPKLMLRANLVNVHLCKHGHKEVQVQDHVEVSPRQALCWAQPCQHQGCSPHWAILGTSCFRAVEWQNFSSPSEGHNLPLETQTLQPAYHVVACISPRLLHSHRPLAHPAPSGGCTNPTAAGGPTCGHSVPSCPTW